jgi:hypothetical protein
LRSTKRRQFKAALNSRRLPYLHCALHLHGLDCAQHQDAPKLAADAMLFREIAMWPEAQDRKTPRGPSAISEHGIVDASAHRLQCRALARRYSSSELGHAR